MKIDPKLVEAILIEQDPEGLISIGAPTDEYMREAERISSRLLNEKLEIRTIIRVITLVFFEAFGTATSCRNDEDVYFYPEYLDVNDPYNRLSKFKTIAKLIYNNIEKE